MRTSLLCALAATAISSTALMGEPITYQGRLSVASLPANAIYEMQFRLYTVASGGSAFATATATVPVIDGLFTAQPDFPAGTFTSSSIYLEVALRVSGSGGTFTVLSTPRQRITAAPLATRSLNERWTVLSSTAIRTDPAVTNVLINTGTSIRADAPLVVGRTTSTSTDLAGMFVNTSAAASKSYYGWATGGVPRAEAHVTSGSEFLLYLNSLQVVDILPTGFIGLGTNATATERLRVNGNGAFTGGLSVAGLTSVASVSATGDIAATGTITGAAMLAYGNVSASGTVSGTAVNATSVTATNYYFATTPTQRYNIPPEEFRTTSPSQHPYIGSTGIAYFDAAVTGASMCAPVHLPKNATILSIDMTFLDNSAPSDIGFNFYRRHITDTAYTVLSVAESFGSSSGVNNITGSAITIPLVSDVYDYSVHVYSTDWQGPVMGVKNIQIRYTVPGPD